MTPRRALVTGASGFIGSRLTHALRRAGWHVEVVVRPHSDQSRFFAGRVHIHDPGSPGALIKVLRTSTPDVIFHLASLFLAEHSSEQVAPLVQSNIQFGTELLEAMAVTGTRRLVNTGTSWQFFHSQAPRSVCLYAATKQAFEAIVDFYVDAHNLHCITLKLFDTYGPGDHRRKLLHLLQQVAASGVPIGFSPGEQSLDLLHIDDAVGAFLIAGERLLTNSDRSHEKFSLSSGVSTPLRAVIDLYRSECKRSLPIHLGTRPYRRREVMEPWTGGVRLPGWEPAISLQQGLRDLIAGRSEQATGGIPA